MQTKPRIESDSKQVIWKRWQEGQSLSDIARAIDRTPASVFGYLRTHGGIQPAQRTRSRCALTFEEREDISRGLSSGMSIRGIAEQLERSPSTVSREIKRNGGSKRYRAKNSDCAAWLRAKRPKKCTLSAKPKLQTLVSSKLSLNWSPEQIAGWLKQVYPGDESMYVSHETIYKSLYLQARGVLKKELQGHLRTRRKFRQSRHYRTKGVTRGQIIDGVSISQRPAEVEDRAIPGHWEGDLISGSSNSHIATVVERTTRFTVLVKVDGKDTLSVVSALAKQMSKLPDILSKTLTWDRGMELASHKVFTIATDIDVYFCDPRSPWQRGTNENTNGLLRQYFPKGTCLSGYTQSELNQVAKELNNRPRKTLGFQSPAVRIAELLQ